MNNIDDLPAGVAARLRALEDEEDDDVDHTIPRTWGADNASSIFRSQAQTFRPASVSGSQISEPVRHFARALAPLKKRLDPYESRDQDRSLLFSTAVCDIPENSTWDPYDPDTQDQSQVSRKSQRRDGQAAATDRRYDINDPRNRALEGTFSSTSVKRVVEEGSGASGSPLNELLENPDLDIDANVRANFPTIDQLHRLPAQLSTFAMRNPNLVASNRNASISTVIAGETITYTPKSGDSRLSKLDRHGKYIGEDLGPIKKSLLRQYKENVQERDRQMLQATAEYRALAAMSGEERTELLERLRMPYEWEGAWEEDQYDAEIPVEYTRDMPRDRERVMRWMTGEPSPDVEAASTGTAPNNSASTVDNSWIPIEDLDEPDNLVAGSPYVRVVRQTRNQEYFRNALHYGRQRDCRPSSQESSTARAQITARLARARLSDSGTGRSRSGTASSRSLDDPFAFDDSPEFQIPEDSSVECEVEMDLNLKIFYQTAINLSAKHPRVVLIQLNEPVKFTPGAIARRVFGGMIQEMQLFPVQRLAIIIFLHPSEARSFVRHVKKTYEQGREEEIRSLQIHAGWYK
jgi:hypothetical protein